MKRRNLFTIPAAALLLASCAVTSIPNAHADTFVWATWTADTPRCKRCGRRRSHWHYAGFTITYTGQISQLSGGPSWNPASTWIGRSRRQWSSCRRYFHPYGRRPQLRG